MTDEQKSFVRRMKDLASERSVRPWHIFRDFCEMAFCSIAANSQETARRDRYEQRYMKAIEDYERPQLGVMCEMMGTMGLALGRQHRDFLGYIYEDSGFSEQKWGGQFWTPTDVSELMAALIMGDVDRDQSLITIMDPCVGSGRLLLASANFLAREGIEVADRIWVEGTDLDQICYQMSFLQLSFAGVPALVRHGNSLTLESFDWAVTPAGMRLYIRSEELREWLARKPDPPERKETERAPERPAPSYSEESQMDLFG